MFSRLSSLLLGAILLGGTDSWAQEEATIEGGMECNGMCIPQPKPEDHVMVIFAMGGSPTIAAKVKQVIDTNYPEGGLDAAAALKLQAAVDAELKFYIAPESTADIPPLPPGHYDRSSQPVALTGTLYDRGGRHWIKATAIKPAVLHYPERMLAPDQPFVQPGDPLLLQITPELKLKCIRIPAGKAVLGAPFYMGRRYQEEYPRLVTITRPFFLSEVPISQEIWEAVMGGNPSRIKNPQLPVQDPLFPDVDEFCRILSAKSGRKVHLPTAAEWEYAARAGTSNPGFAQKYEAQNSRGPDGYKSVLPVKSKPANAWGLYDMASSWWEITGDRAMYPERHEEVDPHYPASGHQNRASMGIPQLGEGWTISMREFNDEHGLGYSSNKFRIVVETDSEHIPD